MGCECKLSTNKCSSGCINKIDKTNNCKKDSDCIKSKGGNIEGFSENTYYKINYFELKGGNNQLSNWINNQYDGPVSYYNEIVARYGNPYIIVNQPGGLCIWNIDKENDPHIRIELRDEYIPHCVPAKHNDYLYSYVKVYIPPEKLNAVQSISGSVNYDPLKHELFARCASFAANFATLKTVFKILNNEKSNYKQNIMKKDNDQESNKSYVTREVKDNNKKYKEELTWAYYPGAFPNGCQ